jgi:glycosyltransferase involved in cell wall biosynthesis
MRILCIDQFAQLGGGQLCLLDLLPAFHRNGWEIRALVPDQGEYAERLRASHCHVEPLALPHLSNGKKTFTDQFRYLASVVRATSQLRKLLRVWKADLLYVNGPRVLPAAARVSREQEIPLIFHAHHCIAEASGRYLVQSSINASKASVIACCQHVASSLSPRVPANRIKVIYNGVGDYRCLPARRSLPIRDIGIIGRIDPEKGQLDFVRAARIVASRFPHVQFHVVGSPQFSAGEYYAQVLKESQGLPVHFHGWRDDISDVLASLDLLVVSSPCSEATPRVILESLSAGVPILAYSVGGIPEIIDNNQTGFLSMPTPDALASRMAEILETDRVVIELIAQRARAAWREKFHINRWRDHVCDTLTRAANANQPEFATQQPQMIL